MTAASSSSSDLADVLPDLRRAAGATLSGDGGRPADRAAVEELLRIAARLAAARLAESSGAQVADLATPLTPTEAALVCSHLLEEVDLDLFELAMWRSWGRG
jgi:hypothetical protein